MGLERKPVQMSGRDRSPLHKRDVVVYSRENIVNPCEGDIWGAVPEETVGRLMRRLGLFLHTSNSPASRSFLCHDPSPVLLEAGALNVEFINHYVSWSAGKRLTALCFADGRTPTYTSYSTRLSEYLTGLCLEGDQRQAEIHRIFRSDEVKQNTDSVRDSLYVAYGRRTVPLEDFQPQAEGGVTLPTTAGYWKVRFQGSGVVPLPLKWKTSLLKKGFSYAYFPEQGVLFFSNTLAAYYGIPPNAKHLGMQKLNVKREDVTVEAEECPHCFECDNKDKQIEALELLVQNMLEKRLGPGAFTFPAGIKGFSRENREMTFSYRGKVHVRL